MQIIRVISELRETISALHRAGKTVALVPTMGALHDGHLTLVREARKVADAVVVSIFVNPTQFGPNEDFDAYPRQEARDAGLLEGEGVDVLWAPDVATMYPAGHATRVSVTGLDAVLCGAARPGHFDGVGTVVSKLFNQTQADVALFGQKDWQQLAIIRRMAADLDFAVRIIGVPTVRESDGLARSSRNAYLSAEQRAVATALPQALTEAAAALARGNDVAAVLETAQSAIVKAGFDSIDYLDMRDEISLVTLDQVTPTARLFVAARLGATRLIDNIPVMSG